MFAMRNDRTVAGREPPHWIRALAAWIMWVFR